MMWLSRERLLESAVPVPFMIFLHHQGREPAQPQKSDLIKRMSRDEKNEFAISAEIAWRGSQFTM